MDRYTHTHKHLLQTLAFLFHKRDAEDPKDLGDGRATRWKEPGLVNERDTSQPRTSELGCYTGEKELICYSSQHYPKKMQCWSQITYMGSLNLCERHCYSHSYFVGEETLSQNFLSCRRTVLSCLPLSPIFPYSALAHYFLPPLTPLIFSFFLLFLNPLRMFPPKVILICYILLLNCSIPSLLNFVFFLFVESYYKHLFLFKKFIEV